jgi:CTD small phosphatase-like protein 2
LVLDLDETLVHYREISSEEGELRIRPGASSFLRIMAKFYEIMIFTAGMQDYADWAIDHIDGSEVIAHRLYRQHASPLNNYYVKDLSNIGRDVSKTIIVDNIRENFQMQPKNGVFIKTWTHQ